MYRIFEFADVIEAMLTMKAETMGISDGTWSAVLEGQPLTVTVKDGTVTVTREAHPGADVLNREQAQELLLSPLASKGSKVPSEIWKNIPSDWFPLPLYCATAVTLGEWEEVKQRADECHMKTATYIKYMALHGKIVNVDMENANSILGALSRIEKSVTDSRLKCLMDYLLSITDLEQHSKSDQDHS